ncbi:hypothetical protein, variant [Allomyces macrogynus ATCC 38327]|uniref:Arf-GAP domain-containing protein n=1 Tax=Allomyces macrogynus (strain ATCC 38327) TaxID=578462 RepID=A0A0L0TBD9_ALLM3|nr:hypothetical protein, variant [Allomyces macrogynus ATCC 38327]|eukprot:KNE72108.1 hypothetical protein, variant [Allomyces macrogynus ATCC 38327]
MDRDKRRQQEQQERIFAELLREDANAHCADCGARGSKWASWNIGVFLCMRCAGVHRKLGTHISKVKSINMDIWTPEQIDSIRSKGNAKANALFNPNGITPPRNASDRDLENYIRDKYERRVFASQAGRAAAMGSSSGSAGVNRYPTELRQLHDMGFTYDPWNNQVLNETKGNLQAAIDKLITMGNPPSTSSSGPSRSAPQPHAAPLAHAKVVVDKSSPLLRQLKGMGFTDERLNLVALQKADGDLDGAIMLLTDRRRELEAVAAREAPAQVAGAFDAQQYAQQFMEYEQQQQAQQQAQQQQQSPSPAMRTATFSRSVPAPAPEPAKPKNDLLDLLGDDLFSATPAAQQPQPYGMMGMQQQQPQAQFAANPFGGGASVVGSSAMGVSAMGNAMGNPFGDSGAGMMQQQQPTTASKTSDIMSLFGQPTQSQMPFGMQASPFGAMQQQQQAQSAYGMQQQQPFGGMQPQQQQQQPFGGMQQASPFGGMQQQQPQQGASPFGMQATGMTGMGGMGGMQSGMGGMQGGMMGGMGAMGGMGGMGGMGMQQQASPFGAGSTVGSGANYSMPYSAAQVPRSQVGSGTASAPSGFGSPFGASSTAGNPAAVPQMAATPARPDPFADLGGFGGFGGMASQQAKPPSNNPFM